MTHPTELQIVTGPDGKAKWQPVEVVVKKLGDVRQAASGAFQKVWILNPDFETVTEAAYWAKNRQLTQEDMDIPLRLDCKVTVRDGRREYLLADPVQPSAKPAAKPTAKSASAGGSAAKPAVSAGLAHKDDFYVRVASMGLAYAKDLCEAKISLDDVPAVGFQFASKILEIAKELKQAYPDWQ